MLVKRRGQGPTGPRPWAFSPLTKRRGLGGLLFRSLSGLELDHKAAPPRSTSSWAPVLQYNPTSALTTKWPTVSPDSSQ